MQIFIFLFVLGTLLSRLFVLIAFDAYPFESLHNRNYEIVTRLEESTWSQEGELIKLYIKGFLGEILTLMICSLPGLLFVKLISPLIDQIEMHKTSYQELVSQAKLKLREVYDRYREWKYR
jgi:hypothetical protein